MKRELTPIQKWRRGVKQEIIDHYGGQCFCCEEKDIRFLSIDHKNDNGAQHRREVGTGFNFYLYLRNSGYPDGLQAACFNCNMGRALNGGVCPHKQSRHHEFFEALEAADCEDKIYAIMNRAVVSRIPPRARSKMYKAAEDARQRLSKAPQEAWL